MNRPEPMVWNLSGLILEGISGSGKTVILQELTHHPQFLAARPPSTIILSEHHTQRVLEPKANREGLTIDDSLKLLEGHVRYLSELARRLSEMAWCEPGITSHRIAFLLERFHLTHLVQYGHLQWTDVEPLDNCLAGLGTKLAVFNYSPEMIAQRLIDNRRHWPWWMSYIKRIGATDEIVRYFIRQQEELVALARKSKLETRFFDTSLKKIGETTEDVLKFWGLSANGL